MVDSFSNWIEAAPTKTMDAATTARTFIEYYVSRFGVPTQLHSDQGSNFESALFQELCKQLEIRKTHSTAFHPVGNGKADKCIQTLKTLLKARAQSSKDEWDKDIPLCLMAYRSSIHQSTGYTPHYLLFGREMQYPLDLQVKYPAEIPDTPENYVHDTINRLKLAYAEV